MSEISSFNDYGPITWYKRRPIYLATILSGLFVIGMFITAFLKTGGFDTDLFGFSPFYFWKEKYLWQIVTYPLVVIPTFYFIFNIIMFYWFSVDVERYLGRRRYTTLLIFLILAPAATDSLLWMVGRYHYGVLSGTMSLSIGFFIAFATLYPNVEYWASIPMKWLAWAGILLVTMFSMMNHDLAEFLAMVAVCGTAFGYVRFLQRGAEFPKISALFRTLFRRKPKFKVVRADSSPQETLHESIDPLLDKISRTGLSSLTAREKAQLLRARESLLKKPE